MSFFFRNRSNGIVNVKMVITEEKILTNIDKIQKLINPNSKKQIVKLDEDAYFKDLVESVKNYLLEYPNKNNFPRSVYDAAYNLVETATNRFEENTKTIEELIRKREKNIKLASVLRDAAKVVKAKAKNWKEIVKKLEPKYSPDVAEALKVIGTSKDKESEEYKKAEKLVDVRINNLESNLHIEIDMERIEDTSKALSYIGIEISEGLNCIPSPIDSETKEGKKSKTKSSSKTAKQKEQEEPKTPKIGVFKKSKDIEDEIEEESEEAKDYDIDESEDEEIVNESEDVSSDESEDNVNEEASCEEDTQYIEETRFEKKPSLWQRIKNSKIVRTINFILNIKVVLDYPALPEPNSTDK